ncbi:hypothetical protein V3C99_016334 [Haemonchus contortus]
MTSYLQKEKILDQWRNSQMVILHKKGDRDDLRSYRLVKCALQLFTKITLTRISQTLDKTQPLKQAVLRKRFSCLDHIQVVAMVIEVHREIRMPLVLTFVDYEKAFDSVETNAFLSALVDQGVVPPYMKTLADCISRCSATVKLFQRPLPIPIGKGVRQGDTIRRSYSQPRCSGL